jgi:hypothetical protein
MGDAATDAAPCSTCIELRAEVERLRAEARRWRGAFHASKRDDESDEDLDLHADLVESMRHIRKCWLAIARIASRVERTEWIGTEHEDIRQAVAAASSTVLASMVNNVVSYQWLVSE